MPNNSAAPLPASASAGPGFLDVQPQSAAPPAAATSPTTPQPATTSGLGAPVPAALETRADEFSPQVVRGALAMTRSSGGTMSMRLEPESLGSLRIQMQMSQGRVNVQFHAQTAEARGLLNQHVQTLRTAMESHGLKLDVVQIHTLSRPGSSGSTGQEHPHSQSHSGGDSAPRHDAGGQQSRGHADTSERQAQYRQAARHFMNHGQSQASWQQQWNAATTNAPTPSLAG